jgi:hypothetical protein
MAAQSAAIVFWIIKILIPVFDDGFIYAYFAVQSDLL